MTILHCPAPADDRGSAGRKCEFWLAPRGLSRYNPADRELVDPSEAQILQPGRVSARPPPRLGRAHLRLRKLAPVFPVSLFTAGALLSGGFCRPSLAGLFAPQSPAKALLRHHGYDDHARARRLHAAYRRGKLALCQHGVSMPEAAAGQVPNHDLQQRVEAVHTGTG